LGKVVLQDTGGNVGIGTANPTSRLEIAAQDGLKIRGFQPFLTLTDTNTNRRSIFAGGNGDFGFYPDSFIGFSPAVLIKNNSGNVGIGVSDPTSKLEVASSGAGIKATSQGNAVIGYSSAPGFAAIYGENTSNAAGSGVYGRGTNGYAMYAEGNAGQSIDKGGWVKAMLFVLADGTIARCYNGLTGASTGNCGFSIVVTTGSLGGTPAILWYTVNTPFDVSNRFSSATSVGGGDNISVRIIGHGDTYVRVSPFWTHLSPSPVLNSEVPSDFFLIIF
jgi:hypothetical protein